MHRCGRYSRSATTVVAANVPPGHTKRSAGRAGPNPRPPLAIDSCEKGAGRFRARRRRARPPSAEGSCQATRGLRLRTPARGSRGSSPSRRRIDARPIATRPKGRPCARRESIRRTLAGSASRPAAPLARSSRSRDRTLRVQSGRPSGARTSRGLPLGFATRRTRARPSSRRRERQRGSERRGRQVR